MHTYDYEYKIDIFVSVSIPLNEKFRNTKLNPKTHSPHHLTECRTNVCVNFMFVN